jgi:hypothetical protein
MRRTARGFGSLSDVVVELTEPFFARRQSGVGALDLETI